MEFIKSLDLPGEIITILTLIVELLWNLIALLSKKIDTKISITKEAIMAILNYSVKASVCVAGFVA